MDGEIREFVTARSADDLIPILLAGLPNNEAKAGQEDQMAFAEGLCNVLAMPLAIDYRGFDPRKDKVNKGAFQSQGFALLAAICGLSRSHLEQREKRREARPRRITRGIVASVMFTLLAATIVSLFFWRQAVEQRNVAVARQVAAQSELVRNKGRNLIERSVLLSVESMKRVPTLEANLVLRPQLRLLPRPAGVIAVGGEIYKTAFSADGRYVATSTAKDVSVWELPSGRSVAVLPASLPVAAMVFSPDGGGLATGSGAIHSKPDTYMAQVWDVPHGREVIRIPNENPWMALRSMRTGGIWPRRMDWEWSINRSRHTSGRSPLEPLLNAPHDALLRFIALSPDGQRLATQTNRGLNQVWSVPRGDVEPERKFDSSLFAAVFSPDCTRQAVADSGILRIAETSTDRELARINEPEVKEPQFVTNGEWVLASARDDVRVVWNAKDGEEVVRLKDAGKVTGIAASPDRRHLATCSDDAVAQIWDLDGKEVSRLIHPQVNAVAFTGDGRNLVTADIMGFVRVWEATGGREVATFQHEGAVAEIAYSPDGQHLVTNSDDRSLRIWNANTEQEITRVRSEYGVQTFALSPDWKVLAVAIERDTRLLETLTGRDLVRLNMTEGVRQLVFSPDGRQIATAGLDKMTRLWDVASGREVSTLPVEAAIAFRSDGTCLAASMEKSGAGLVWNVNTGRTVVRIEDKDLEGLEGLAFSPEGCHVYAAQLRADAGAITLFDPATGRKVQRFSYHGLLLPTFSRDAKYLTTTNEDGSIVVWRIADGKMLTRVAPRGGITAMVFNHDGKHLLTGAIDGAARIWETATGRELSRMQMPKGTLAMALSPDGKYLATGGYGTAVETWYVHSADLIAEACRRLSRNLTRVEWDEFVGAEPYSATCPNLPAAP